jgi:hypothetical protein
MGNPWNIVDLLFSLAALMLMSTSDVDVNIEAYIDIFTCMSRRSQQREGLACQVGSWQADSAST